MVEGTIVERLAQRYAQAGNKDDLLACAALFNQAPEARQVERLLNGLEKALAATGAGDIPDELRRAVQKAGGDSILTTRVTLGVRLGLPDARKKALEIIASEKADLKKRLEYVRVFTEVENPEAVPVLLQTLQPSSPLTLRKQALAALQRQEAESIGREVVALLIKGEPDSGLRAEMHDLLATRASWARAFLVAIESGKLNPRGVSLDIVRKLLLSRDREVVKLAEKHWGKVRAATSEEKKKEILRLGSILKSGKGDSRAGKLIFANTCGKCHKLFGQGSDVGPELTYYERDNLLYWLENVVDPSAMIRDEYLTFNVETKSGRTLVGIIAQQDRESVTLKDGEGKVIRLPRSRIADLRASTTSLMPEDQLKALKDQEIRDLFAFLTSPTPVR
jgi:putative heme-binding domain-containing protein